MLRRIGIVSVALLMVVGTADVFAQGGRPGGGQFRGGFNAFGGGTRSFASLLRIEEVQTELEMTDAQKEELGDMLTPQRGFGAFGQRGGDGQQGGQRFRRGQGQDGEGQPGGDNPQRRQRPQRDNGEVQAQDDNNQPGRPGGRQGFQNLTEEQLNQLREERAQREREEEDKIADVLEEAQLARLIGIYIQVNGVSSLTHRWVAERLELSGKQKDEIEKAREETQQTLREQMQAAFQGDGDRQEAFAKIRELREKADEEVMMVLTGAQREKMDEMKGEEFELPQRGFGGFGGQGGPGGRPGGGEGGGDRPRRPQRPGSDDAV